MSATPAVLALTNIADGANIVAADHRNNYSAVQTGWNQLIDILNDGVAGQVLNGTATTLSWAYPSGYEFGYTEFTSLFQTTVTSEATAAAVVTAPAVTFDGSTSVIVEFFSVLVDVSTAARSTGFYLYDGSSSIGQIGQVDSPTSGYGAPALLRRKITPAAATKTYSIRAAVNGGAGTTNVWAGLGGVGAIMPGYIRITKA